MAVPFVIDLVTIVVYAADPPGNSHLLPPIVLLSAAFLVVGVGIGAYFLIRPIQRFIAGEVAFADVEKSLSRLPRRSAADGGLLCADDGVSAAVAPARHHLDALLEIRPGPTSSPRSSSSPASTCC